MLKPSRGRPQLGLAYSGRIPELLESYPDLVDYVEVPYELLRHNPAVEQISAKKQVVLHCASLSLAGAVRPAAGTVADVRHWAERTRTPWVGEHLSFITAQRLQDDDSSDAYAPGEPWNIGYTVSPAMNEATLNLVVGAVAAAERELPVPLILENPPVYFTMPGSTMSQVEFISALCARSNTRLLLDLAHFYITAKTLGYEPEAELLKYPLDRVVEVHISGVDDVSGSRWDNHAARAPQAELDLLAVVAERRTVQAITLEYNWSSRFPTEVLLEEIARVRQTVREVTSA